MKRSIYFMVLCMMTLPALAATSTGRLGIVKSPVAAANRVAPSKMASMSVNTGTVTATENLNEKSSIRYEETKENEPQPEIDRREKEKAACIQNNIGIGNTFVWASRYSNINDYSTMIEDVDNPENNTCFVNVSVKSNDSRIDLSNIRGRYYEMGRNITCGAWVDEDMIEKRILDAKKNARTWATVGGAVGGATIGVASMELFGNKLIGGAVEGQKDENLSSKEVLRSQILAMKSNNKSQYDEMMNKLGNLKKLCAEWEGDVNTKPEGCTKYDFDFILGIK